MTPVTVTKRAGIPERFRRPCRPFRNARSAFRAFLEACAIGREERVLLPAYVGWSPREGSGVFDPVAELGLAYGFYAVRDDLSIDLESLEAALRPGRCRVLVIIHYFGRVAGGYEDAVRIARERGALVLEDEAHAMLTDLQGGLTGRLGDACIFSLHKLLPVDCGGMLVLNEATRGLPVPFVPEKEPLPVPWDFDLDGISRRRRETAERLGGLLRPLEGHIDPLWQGFRCGEVPQTFPVRVRGVSRDRLYEAMNASGFGVVSLYHTLIPQIREGTFSEARRLSREILNLPVHQDVGEEGLERMVEQLVRSVRALAGEGA